MSSTKPLASFLIAYSNSEFTNPHEVVLPDAPQDCRSHFTHMGAKYSGFESRRHTTTRMGQKAFTYDHDAHDWLVIGLQERAEIDTIAISTQWFTGNQVRTVSVYLIDAVTGGNVQVLERKTLNPDAQHPFSITPTMATECRIECYYDGGIARVHLFGAVTKDQPPVRSNRLEGATISQLSNDHYGNPAQAVAGNRKESHMVGWESARTGYGERALFHLNKPTIVDEIIVDTYLHRLNAPLSCHVFGLHEPDASKVAAHMLKAPRWKLVFSDGREIIPDDFQDYMLEQKYLEEKGNHRTFQIVLHLSEAGAWKPILPFAPLSPDTFHRFRSLPDIGAVTHVLYMHYPNGGIHGLKVFGHDG